MAQLTQNNGPILYNLLLLPLSATGTHEKTVASW